MASSPLTPDQLFARLDALGIDHKTYIHPPVFTVAEAVALRGQLPGGHCKSLFLKDKKGGLWLVVALEECRVDLKTLGGKNRGCPKGEHHREEMRLHLDLDSSTGQTCYWSETFSACLMSLGL